MSYGYPPPARRDSATSPTSRCRSCDKGPIGIVGHNDLFADTLTPRMQFHCQICGYRWVRVKAKEGEFVWSEMLTAEPAGELPPGRRNSPAG